MECPDCSGEGEVVGLFAIRSDGSGCDLRREFPCSRCNSTGTVSDKMSEWIEAGKRIRADRRARNMTLREEAKARGLRPSELSDMEIGRLDPCSPLPRARKILLRVLPTDQLAEVLSALETDEVDARSIVIAGAHDGETLTLISADGESATIPLSAFQPNACVAPDFSRFELDDHGHTIRFGEYEASAEFALADYRSRHPA